MPERIRGAWAKFWHLVDGDSVRPFIPLYYTPFLLWGVYGTFFASPITLIVDQMSQAAYDAWVWMPIPATTAALAGLAMRHGGAALNAMSTPLLFRDWMGLYLQLAGHACMFLVLLTFEITSISGAYWGQPVISVFLISSYTIGVLLLAMQCARKIQRGLQLGRRL